MIRHCDARDGLAQLETGSVDLVVCDPHYTNISGGNKNPKAPKGILTANDGKASIRHNHSHVADYADELFRVLKDNAHCYVMTNLKNLFRIKEAFIKAGFKLHNLLGWKKNTANPNRWYMKNQEYTLFFRKGKPFRINDCGKKSFVTCDELPWGDEVELIHEFPNPTGDAKLHPTEKPVGLMRLYIEQSSQPGDVVLDPFMGSGTTGVAARQAGREFIGFDIDLQHVMTACRRLGVMPS